MNIKEEIREAIETVIGSLTKEKVPFVVEHPVEENHGDYATNVALVVFRFVRDRYKNPRELAEVIVAELKKKQEIWETVDGERVEIAGAGFINFWLKKDYLLKEVDRVSIKGGDYGKGDWGKGKRVLVEYSSPNIAKSFSVGHFRSTVYGQTVRNLYDFAGFTTVGDNHLGDWGTQFGMIIALVEEKGLDLAKMSIEEVEKEYVEYNKRAKEAPEVLERARDAFARLEKGEKNARGIWEVAVRQSLEEYERIYQLLGVRIENSYGESSYEGMLSEVIEEMKKKGVTKLSQEAWIVEFPDMPPAMLLKSNGTTTYFTRDMATIKFRNLNPKLKSDLYIYEVGAEQQLHFQQVFAAAEMMGWGKREDFIHIWHGLILGKDGKKMSTRKGTTIKIEKWLEEMVGKAREIKEESAGAVGIGAVKYFDLKHDPTTSYRFSWEEALRLDGDSGPYLQYAVVRAKSVLAKVGKEKKFDFNRVSLNGEEERVVRWLYRFPEVVEKAAREFSPNILCAYLFELASRFNGFYNKHQVISSENEGFRLQLVRGVAQVLENGLTLLGIEVPEKM